MKETPVDTTSTKTRNAGGAPKGSQNALKHGVFSLERARKRGQIDKRTSPYRAIKKIEREITAKHAEARKRWHAANAAKLQYYCQRIDDHLLTFKGSFIRKGKVNPAVDLRLRLGEAVDRDYEAYDAIVRGDRPLDLARRIQLEQMQNTGKR
jgi:hypothetical protein